MAEEAMSNGAINSMDDAKAVARLLKDGKIQGAGRDKALADLRAFDHSVQHEATSTGKNAVESMGTGEKLARGFAAGATSIGHGIKQAFAEATNSPNKDALRQETDSARSQNAALLNTTAGKIGNFGGELAATGPAALIPGAGTVLGGAAVGAGLGALQPVGTKDSRLNNTVSGAIGGATGQVAGRAAGYVAGKVVDKLAPKAAAGAATVLPKNVTPEAAQAVAKGYKLPPSMAKAKPSILEGFLEGGLAGKIRTEQEFSIPNQKNTNGLARKALGLGDGDEIHLNEVIGQRKAAGEEYQKVREISDTAFPGFTNVKMKPDASYNSKLDAISGTFKNYAERFPSIFKNAKVDKMIKDIRKPMNTDEAVQLSNKLREDSAANYKAAKGTVKALGKAQKKAADAIDQLLEDHLQAASKTNPALKDAYEGMIKSRQIIAKTYDVEKVLDDHTGNIDAPALARLSRRRPLSGELKDIADFGSRFEGAARVPTRKGSRLGPEISKTEMGVATLAAAAGSPHAAGKLATGVATALAPLGGRKLLMSKAYQNTLKAARATPAGKEALRRAGTVSGALTLQDQDQK